MHKKKEKAQARNIASLLIKGRRRFENYDFSYAIDTKNHGDIIVKGSYKIHLTPKEGIHNQKFLVSRVDNPSEAYYSESYPEAKNVKSSINALDNLIDII